MRSLGEDACVLTCQPDKWLQTPILFETIFLGAVNIFGLFTFFDASERFVMCRWEFGGKLPPSEKVRVCLGGFSPTVLKHPHRLR